jgi:hypothetical protein
VKTNSVCSFYETIDIFYQVRPVANEQDTYHIEHLSLQIRFSFDNPTGVYRIHLQSLFDASQQQQQQQQTNFIWQSDDLQILETFFNDTLFPLSISPNTSNPVMMPSLDILSLGALQNRSTAIGALEKMLSVIHPRVLRDLVKIIRLEQVRSMISFHNR